jgi:U11/U12 small nuclear ribonucleoprotein SNRNP25
MKRAFVCGCGVAIVFFFFVMSKSPQRLIEELEKEINRILNDELLKDVNLAVSTEELDALIAVEQEQAYRIKIERESLKPISNVCFCYKKKNSTNLTNIFVDLIVGQSNTVKDIKKLIQVKLERIEKDEKTGRKRKISW